MTPNNLTIKLSKHLINEMSLKEALFDVAFKSNLNQSSPFVVWLLFAIMTLWNPLNGWNQFLISV